ncbi:hypothetical protein CBR_g50659 [Chara braunii]|uniref:Uncharacterized protein n=1 Tax=Chara braunii TaxID=69332 RepID=A0A388M7I0_CHABU|nr:hypothetical protein CBR_g50659 [Chara braunii]|eukprot:GBG90412.1 hypothetical protein CBR_g50659 [Chara braunii]
MMSRGPVALLARFQAPGRQAVPVLLGASKWLARGILQSSFYDDLSRVERECCPSALYTAVCQCTSQVFCRAGSVTTRCTARAILGSGKPGSSRATGSQQMVGKRYSAEKLL